MDIIRGFSFQNTSEYLLKNAKESRARLSYPAFFDECYLFFLDFFELSFFESSFLADFSSVDFLPEPFLDLG